MGKDNGKVPSDTLRAELRELDESIAELEAEVAASDAEVKRLLLPRRRRKGATEADKGAACARWLRA